MTAFSSTAFLARAFVAFMFILVLVVYYVHVTDYYQPDRPFTFDQTLAPGLVALICIACFMIMEFAYRSDVPTKFIIISVAATILLIMALHVTGLKFNPKPVNPEVCSHTYANVILAESDHHADLVKRDFGPNYMVWKHESYADVKNLTESMGVEYQEDHGKYSEQVAHLVSTYGLLNHYHRNSPMQYVVVLESNSKWHAKSLPDFDARIRDATCSNPMADIIILHGVAVLRMSVTGGFVDTTVGMIYRRDSIPQILEWLELDNKEADKIALRDHADEGYQRYAINHLIADACYTELKCIPYPAVIEEKKREH